MPSQYGRRHLEHAGVEIRPQKKMTPDLVAQATALYIQDYSLVEVGKLLGLEASVLRPSNGPLQINRFAFERGRPFGRNPPGR